MSEVIDGGTLTQPAPVGSNTLSDSTKQWALDIQVGRTVVVKTPAGTIHTFQVAHNSSSTLVLESTIDSEIPQYSQYQILGFDIDSVIRNTLGGGVSVDLPAEFAAIVAAIGAGLLPLEPLEKGTIHNTGVLADTDFFAAAIAPTNVPTLFRIQVSMDTQGTFNVTVTNGGNTQTLHMNRGVPLMASNLYMFDILVAEGDTINLQYSEAATIEVCRVQEIIAGVQ